MLGLHLALLNFDAGNMPAGDRGLAADPDRTAQLRANVPLALRIAADCGCPRLNLLAGLRDQRYPLDQQLQLARDNVAWAADQAAESGRQVMIEALNSMENGPCLLTTTTAAADVPGRGEPGTGEINYQFLLGYLDRKGYHDCVGLEYRPSGGRPEDSFGWLEEYGRRDSTLT